jgi:16S rRNA (guanine527-N7)-methyltransferase
VSESLFSCFPFLSDNQISRLLSLKALYETWNSRINVISRRDMDEFMVHHVLHSLSIARVIPFLPGSGILDVGTGGGFPGIPLAIMFPCSRFTLLDSIEKKIKVVTAVAAELELENVIPLRKRAEEEYGKYQYVIGRAVTTFSAFVKLTGKNIDRSEQDKGIICLKGGDLSDELAGYKNAVRIWEIKDLFEDPYFETKKIVYLPF